MDSLQRTDLFDLVIRGGKLVTATRTYHSDIGIRGEKIAAIGPDLEGARVVEARGLLILPGAIDPHVHLEMPVGETHSSDDWFTGTRAAACGGTTTVIDFVEPGLGEGLEHALAKRRERGQGRAAVDFGLHMTLVNDKAETLQEVPGLLEEGCTSFKTYLTYEGFRLSDSAFLHVLCVVKEAGGTLLVHAENDTIIAHLQRRFRAEKKTAPKYHALSRPPIAEAEAIQRSLALAEVTGARLYVVHISTALGADALHSARQRGVNASGETCPQYLLLTDKELSRPGFAGAKYVCSPPLRSLMDNERLWKGLADDDLQTVGTDHCPFNYKGQKDLGRDNYEKIPSGLPGIESRLSLLYQYGVRMGRLSLERWVEVCSTNPAKIFGLYPRKGSLEPGADADMVLFDPNKKVTLSRSLLHEQVDYTPYKGFELQGYPVMTFLRGKLIVKNGEFTGAAGDGKYLVRGCSG
ncbi:MAG: dihydropyrimidinase [Chloroflexi bacterium]|nr:dihydropyrimidinase [Chloroflexota bacterium]